MTMLAVTVTREDARVYCLANNGVVNRPKNLRASCVCFVHADEWGKLSRCAQH